MTKGTLVKMIGAFQADPLLRVAIVAYGVPKGGDRVGKTTSKVTPKKKAAAKPKGPIGKSVKRK